MIHKFIEKPRLLYYTHNGRVDLFDKYYKVNETLSKAWEIVFV